MLSCKKVNLQRFKHVCLDFKQTRDVCQQQENVLFTDKRISFTMANEYHFKGVEYDLALTFCKDISSLVNTDTYMHFLISFATRLGGSNEYSQSMLEKCKPLNTPFLLYYKSGVEWGLYFMDMFS